MLAEEVRFKFKFVNQEGQEEGFLSTKGRFDGQTLHLGEIQISAIAIVRAIKRFNRLVLGILQQDGTVAPVVIAVNGRNLQALRRALNNATSAARAELHQQLLVKEGKGASFRSEQCPYCGSTVDLTDRLRTPQVFCPYCDSIVTLGGAAPSDERTFRLCDECGYYAQPKEFTTFYFYFLFVVYGFSYDRKYMCNVCMRKEAWKMFAANFIFVLGVPFAVWQLVRAYAGGSALSRAFAGLDSANAHGRKGRLDQAEALYRQIEANLTHCAGVKFNHGQMYRGLTRYPEAETHFLSALEDCANFLPAYEALCGCYHAEAKHQELEALRKVYKEVAEEQAGPGGSGAEGAAEQPGIGTERDG